MLRPHVLASAFACIGGPIVTGDVGSGALWGSIAVEPQHRYMLWRVWDDRLGQHPLLWIMLNPSTATHDRNDPTIRRCIEWSKRWGFGGLVVVNAYGYCATHPKRLLETPARVGELNDRVLQATLAMVAVDNDAMPAHRVIVAWGANIESSRERELKRMFVDADCRAFCFGRSRGGHPLHPVRLAYNKELQPWI